MLTNQKMAVSTKPPQNVPLREASIFLPGPVVPTRALTSVTTRTDARRRP